MAYENMPEELKAMPNWVCWKYETSDTGRKTKIPYDPMTGKRAESNNKNTWSKFETVKAAAEKGYYDGIGFMFGESSFCGVDIDGGMNPITGVSELAKEIIEMLDSYTEYSPSGTGVHIICKGSIPPGARKNSALGIEMYESGRYFTMTSNVAEGRSQINERTEQLAEVHKKYWAKPERPKEKPTGGSGAPCSMSANQIIDKAMKSAQGSKFKSLYDGNWQGLYGSQSEADQAFCNMLAFWTGKDAALMDEVFRCSGLMREKWDRTTGDSTYGELTMQEAIRTCTTVYDPEYGKVTPEAAFGKPGGRQKNEPVVVKASDVPYEPPRWLIPPYFQRGKGTLIQADNGIGKTAFMCAVAAHVSAGRSILGIPIETPGNILVLSVEDDLPVLRGRIEENGGNLDRCHFMTNAAGLTFNSPEVEEAIKQINAKMVIFDPFQAFLGANIRMAESNQTRPELAKLFEMADRNDCSIAIIAHIGKDSMFKSSVNRSLGSVDIPAAMRSIFQIVQNPDNEKELVAVHVKCSNAPKGRSISFAIGDRGGVQWIGFSDMTAEDLNAIIKRKEKGIPYEREPLVQVFNQLITDKPGGGFWSYEDLKVTGMKILGFPPFSDSYDLKAKLNSSLARELQERDGLIVTCGHRNKKARGVRIEQYQHPDGYQTSVPTEGDDDPVV